MSLFRRAILLLVTAQSVLSANNNFTANDDNNGCKLVVPPAVQKRMEPDGEPVLVQISFMNIKIRDVPNKGGYFGVEFRYIITIQYNGKAGKKTWVA